MSSDPNLDLYKTYLEDVARIGARHEAARKFYLSVVSALFVFLSLTGEKGPLKVADHRVEILVGILGIILGAAWFAHMQSFGAIYKAKFDVLRDMEKDRGLYPCFTKEWDLLKPNRRYHFLTQIDSLMPVLFTILFLVLIFLSASAKP